MTRPLELPERVRVTPTDSGTVRISHRTLQLGEVERFFLHEVGPSIAIGALALVPDPDTAALSVSPLRDLVTARSVAIDELAASKAAAEGAAQAEAAERKRYAETAAAARTGGKDAKRELDAAREAHENAARASRDAAIAYEHDDATLQPRIGELDVKIEAAKDLERFEKDAAADRARWAGHYESLRTVDAAIGALAAALDAHESASASPATFGSILDPVSVALFKRDAHVQHATGRAAPVVLPTKTAQQPATPAPRVRVRVIDGYEVQVKDLGTLRGGAEFEIEPGEFLERLLYTKAVQII